MNTNKKQMPAHIFSWGNHSENRMNIRVSSREIEAWRCDGFTDVKRACERWLQKRGIPSLPMGQMVYGKGRHVSRPGSE